MMINNIQTASPEEVAHAVNAYNTLVFFANNNNADKLHAALNDAALACVNEDGGTGLFIETLGILSNLQHFFIKNSDLLNKFSN